MKKVFFTLMIVFAMVTAAVAQPRAIGARLGGNLEFSYQHSLAQGNMMVDLTAGVTNVWNNWAQANVTAMFDWVWAIGASNWNCMWVLALVSALTMEVIGNTMVIFPLAWPLVDKSVLNINSVFL